MAAPAYRTQLLLSLLTAVVITIAAIAVVTATIGPGLDATELRERRELVEERNEAREERREERSEDGSGSG